MNKRFRSLAQAFLTAACALSLTLTGFDLPAQAQSNGDGGSTTLSSHAAAPQKKRRRTRRRSRSARPVVARMKEVRAVSNSSVPVGTLEDNPDYIPPGGATATDEQKPGVARRAIQGGILNGKAISLPKPAYPAIARSARASGTVIVLVTIDESGKVVSARAVSGHPLLQAAAVQAAYGARFSPTQLSGQPVKVTGTISYNFVQ
jgi:TonB family protein